MIRVEKGAVEMRGMVNEIQADLTIALKTFRDNIKEGKGEETADKMIEDIVKMSKKNKEELEEEAEKKKEEVRKMLYELFEGANKECGGKHDGKEKRTAPPLGTGTGADRGRRRPDGACQDPD